MELLMTKKINNKKYMKLIYEIIPYILILLLTFVACQLNFKGGYPSGDDIRFHTSNIYDWYLDLKGDRTSLISSNMAGGIGVGKRLFYSPFAHFVPAFIAYLFKISILKSMKITLFLSVFISGIFMYRFALKISKKMTILSVLVAGIYVLWPYRLFDAYCRIAYAEAISFLFLPLFFMGLYDLCHYKELNIIPFLEIIFGSVLLFLTHNLTGFYAFVFGSIYLLINIKKIIDKIKDNKLILIYSIITGFIIIGMLLLTVCSSYSLMNKDYYNISNEKYMWTNVGDVTNRTNDAIDYSGFLNITWLKGQGLTPTKLFGDIVLFFISILILVLINEMIKLLLNKYNRFKVICFINKYQIYLIIPLIIFIIFVHKTISRKEVTIASYVSGIFYILLELFKEVKTLNNNKKPIESAGFYSYVILLIITLLMIFVDDFWKIAPQLFLNIQFPWRLWAFVSLFVPVIICYIFRKYNSKNAYIILGAFLGLLTASTMATVEKRLAWEQDKNKWFHTIDKSIFNSRSTTGWNDEYYPYMYYNKDNTYVSKYDNSLYSKVKLVVSNYTKSAYNIEPAILEGSGTVIVDKEKTKVPNYYIDAEIQDDNTLIQLPIIYYPGYEVKAKLDTGKTIKCKVIDVDGLVSFYLDSGNYRIKTDYVGTNLRHFTEVMQVFSVIMLFGFSYLDYIVIFKKNRNKDLLIK